MKNKNHLDLTPLKRYQRIRKLLLFFLAALVASGLSAFPIEWQLSVGREWIDEVNLDTPLTRWIELAHTGMSETNLKFPFIAYGTDWLAFAHLVIAIAFIGPIRDPIKNVWVIEFGLIACIAVIPMALIAGEVRSIPVFWRLIDCLFGIIGGSILFRCYSDIKTLEKLNLMA